MIKKVLSNTLWRLFSYCKLYLQLEDGKEYKYREPTQKPINPPYQSALALKRGEQAQAKDNPEDSSTIGEDSMSALSLEASSIDTESK